MIHPHISEGNLSFQIQMLISPRNIFTAIPRNNTLLDSDILRPSKFDPEKRKIYREGMKRRKLRVMRKIR